MASPTFPLAFMLPVAWLVTAHFPCLGLRGLAINPGCLVEDPRTFCTEALWEKAERFLFLASRRQAKNSRGGVLNVHVDMLRHFANSQIRIVAR